MALQHAHRRPTLEREAMLARLHVTAALLSLFLYSGFCLQAMPVMAPAILADWRIAARALALPLALTSIGTGLGSFIGGLLSDRLGRKGPIVGFTLLQACSLFLCGLTAGPMQLYGPLFLVGLGLGGYFSSSMALITEIAPIRQRGLMISLAILFSPLGLGLCSLVAAAIVPHWGWSSLFYLGGISGLPLAAWLAFILPESPSFLSRFPDRQPERAQILRRLALEAQSETAVGETPVNQAKTGTLRTLLSNGLGMTITLWSLFFIMYILGSVVLGWLPVVLSQGGFSMEYASRSLFFWTAGSMIGTPLAGYAMARLGNYRTGLIFFIGSVVALAALALTPATPANSAVIATILPLTGLAIAGVVTTLYAIAANSYPATIRATGIGVADAIGRAGGVLGAFAGVYALEMMGPKGFFTSILALAILSNMLLIAWHISAQKRPAP